MNKFIRSCILSVFVALTLCSVSFASHPLITDDTGTQGKGKFQLEVNGGYGQGEGDGITTKTTQISTSLAYGLSDPLDIMIGLPYLRTRVETPGTVTRQDGMAAMSLEMKWRFYEKDGLSFALKPSLTFPTGDDKKGLGSGRVTYRLFFIGTMEIEPWAFHFNLGYIRNENKLDEDKDLWHGSLATTVEVMKDLKLIGNTGLESNTDRHLSTPKAFILWGVIYSLSENFDIDFGVKGGLTNPEEDYTILAGITWRF